MSASRAGDIRVKLKPSYPICLRATFEEVYSELEEDHGERPWMLVADRRLLSKHPRALRGLSRRRQRQMILLNGGETVKSPAQFWKLHRAAADFGLDRQALVVAVGGGTIGDLTGFFASTWMRGVDWIPVATTSLAMADSSLGGKTAINLGRQKNLVGTFHQPRAVYGALEALESLPARHLRAGLAEIIKCALIADRTLYRALLRKLEDLHDPQDSFWEEALRRSCAVKSRIVAADPHEAASRALLNYGHTVGHALEATATPRPLHGEAVALGMIAATQLAEDRAMTPKGATEALEELLKRAGLPRRIRQIPLVELWKALRADKKAQRGDLRMVLSARPGEATAGHRIEKKELDRAMSRIWSSSRGGRP